jgi:HSP20 family protein
MTTKLTYRDPFDMAAPLVSFNRLWDQWLHRSDGGHMVSPAMDVAETEAGFTITAELPGLKKEDVKITIEDGVLSIAGEKKFETEQKEKNYHRIERSYGAFHRSVTLPSGINADKAEADFSDGVLTIHVPKTESARPKTLTIK